MDRVLFVFLQHFGSAHSAAKRATRAEPPPFAPERAKRAELPPPARSTIAPGGHPLTCGCGYMPALTNRREDQQTGGNQDGIDQVFFVPE